MYFAVLVAAAWVRPLSASRRISITVVGAAMCAGIAWLPGHATGVQRDWAPVAIILVGYYLSPAYKEGVALMLFLVVILFRPEGLLGKAEERKV